MKKDCIGCYSCGLKGYMKRDCPKQSEKTQDEANSAEKDGTTTRQAFLGSSDAALDDLWVIDSGASDHMTRRHDWFSYFEEFDRPTVKVNSKSWKWRRDSSLR